MNMWTKFQVDIFKNGWGKTFKKRHFSRHFGILPWFSQFYFWPILTLQNVFEVHLSRSFRKYDLMTCITALNTDFFCLPYLGTWWPQMTFTFIMVTKHKNCYFQISVILSIPIHWIVCASHRNVARRCRQARNIEHSDFDPTCDVISDL